MEKLYLAVSGQTEAMSTFCGTPAQSELSAFGDWLRLTGNARVSTCAETPYIILQTGYITNADKLKGSSCLSDSIKTINGSFALIKINTKNRVITILSDRWASRALWYYYDNGTWHIASDLMDMSENSPHRRSINAANFTSLLMRGRPADNGSLLAGIQRMRPGEAITLYPDGHTVTEQWHRLKYIPDKNLSFGEAASVLAAYLAESAANVNKTAERSPILFLSGGMDSRLTLSAFTQEVRPYCVTLGDKLNYEASVAMKVAASAGTKNRLFLRDQFWYLRDLENFVRFSGGCYHFSHAHFSQACKMPDIGGSDFIMGDWMELFQKVFYNENATYHTPKELANALSACDGIYANNRWTASLSVIKPKYQADFYNSWHAKTLAKAEEAFSASSELPLVCEYLLRTNSVYELPTFAMHENIRMAGQEYALFWDNKVSDFMFSLPYALRKHSRLSCEVIKKLAPELLTIPNANTMLPPALPPAITTTALKLRSFAGAARKKFTAMTKSNNYSHMGSWQNLHLLCSTNPVWTEYINKTIFHNIDLPEFIDMESAKNAWTMFQSGHFEYAFEIYALLNLAIINSHNGNGQYEL